MPQTSYPLAQGPALTRRASCRRPQARPAGSLGDHVVQLERQGLLPAPRRYPAGYPRRKSGPVGHLLSML